MRQLEPFPWASALLLLLAANTTAAEKDKPPAGAAIPITAEKEPVRCDNINVAPLLVAYKAGIWKGRTPGELGVQELGLQLIASCHSDQNLDLTKDAVVLLLGDLDFEGKPVEIPVLVRNPPAPRPYEVVLAGLGRTGGRLFELYLRPDFERLTASYSEVRDPDPVAAQAGTFGSGLLGANLTSITGLVGKVQPPQVSMLTAFIAPPPPPPLPGIIQTAPLPPNAVLIRIDIPYKRGTITAQHLIQPPPPPAPAPAASPEPFVSVYKNRPPRHLTFGALSGVRFASKTDDRAKVDGGNMQPDPLALLVTMAVVNFHPWGYDDEAPDLTPGERHRLFAGVTITPGFGVGGGYGFSIVRGLSFNLGMTGIFYQGLNNGDHFGQPPNDVNSASRTKLGWAAFAGLSFGLK